jgi:uncharacterized protein (PEP-CTERM system associated)
MAKPQRPRAAPVTLLAALLAAPAAQAAWTFTPTVALTETYSDNVSLQSSENAHGQFITDVTPGFLLASNGPRLKLSARYALHYFTYSGEQPANTRRTQQELNGNMEARLIDDLLFLDASAARGTRGVSGFGPQAAGNLYSTTNQANVSTWRLSPYLRYRFGPSADVLLRYSHDAVKSGDLALGDSSGDTVALSVVSGPRFPILGWGFDYLREDLDHDIGGQSLTETASASLSYRLVPTLRLIGSGGYDRFEFDGPGGREQGPNWSLGANWIPSPRTSLRITGGQRYFGPTYSLAAAHRSRRSVWDISYSDSVTTARSQYLMPSSPSTSGMLEQLFRASIADPVERERAVAAYIQNNGRPTTVPGDVTYFSNRFLRLKRVQASVALTGARSTGIVSVFGSRNTELSDEQLQQPGTALTLFDTNTEQVGASALGTYALSPRSAAHLDLTATHISSLVNDSSSNQTTLRTGLSTRVGRSVRAVVEYRHTRGSVGAFSDQKYRENAISATLSMQL